MRCFTRVTRAIAPYNEGFILLYLNFSYPLFYFFTSSCSVGDTLQQLKPVTAGAQFSARRWFNSSLYEDQRLFSLQGKPTFLSDLNHRSQTEAPIICHLSRADIRGSSVCPGRALIANKDGGYISSPNYPLNYGNTINCVFTLIVPARKKTHIEFEEMKIECKYMFWFGVSLRKFKSSTKIFPRDLLGLSRFVFKANYRLIVV